MNTNRLEAFSDGVLAIIITVMVLELRTPAGPHLAELRELWPVFLSYVLSFVYVGIYWNNHHHMLQATTRVTGGVLWANLHLLFWLSLTPFTTSWMGEDRFARLPVAVYGFDLVMAAVAYTVLQWRIIAGEGSNSPLAKAIGNDVKGKFSGIAYVCALPLSLVSRWISLAIFAVVALVWLIPDRRIETMLSEQDNHVLDTGV